MTLAKTVLVYQPFHHVRFHFHWTASLRRTRTWGPHWTGASERLKEIVKTSSVNASTRSTVEGQEAWKVSRPSSKHRRTHEKSLDRKTFLQHSASVARLGVCFCFYAVVKTKPNVKRKLISSSCLLSIFTSVVRSRLSVPSYQYASSFPFHFIPIPVQKIKKSGLALVYLHAAAT